MKEELIFIIIALLLITIGWFVNDLYSDFNYKSKIKGMWLQNNITKDEALNYVYERETAGSWVCVNIRGQTIDQMRNTIEHEIAHEVFAQKCSSNATKCLLEVGMN